MAVSGDRFAARPLTRDQRVWLIAIVAVAAALRLWWVIYATRSPKGLHDPSFYVIYGDSFATGRGYRLFPIGPHAGEPTAYYPVGYPAALGVVFWLVHHTPLPDNLPRAAAFFNLGLGVATVVLAFEVARRLFDNRVGLVTAGVIALWPNLIFHTGVALTETLFNFLVMAALLVLVWRPWGRSLPWGRLAVFGVLTGASAMVRPISLLFLPVLLVVMLVFRFGWRRALGQTVVAGVAAGLVILPWTVRNIIVMDSPVLISTNLGDNLCIGRHPGASGGFDVDINPNAAPQGGDNVDYCFHDLGDTTRPAYEIRRNNLTTRRAVSYLVHHPVDEARLLFWRTYFTMQSDHDALDAAESYKSDPFIRPRTREVLETVADAWFFAAVAIGFLALPAFRSRRDPRRPFFFLAMASQAAAPLVFFGDVRFHVPVLPLWAVGVAVALVTIREELRRSGRTGHTALTGSPPTAELLAAAQRS